MGVFVERDGNWEAMEVSVAEHVLPSRLEMLVSFAKATARFVAAGAPVVAEGTFRERLAACQACEYWIEAEERCARCGCKGLKLWMGTEECPLPEPEKRWKQSLKVG